MIDSTVVDVDEASVGSTSGEGPRGGQESPQTARSRFTRAVVIGAATVVLPYLWVLWDLWNGSIQPLRRVAPDNFYDLQARAMFHGHLYVRSGSLGIEGFLHGGHTYTYFGVWPSIIRMPVLLVTSSLDGKLTAPSLLIAWALTGLFTALLVWRLRTTVRGNADLTTPEAVGWGAFMATVLGGSAILFIGANPSVYNEDFAWSIALVLGSLFTLAGVMERPSARGVAASAFFVVAASSNRTPTGYACVITAFLVAGWLGVGRGGSDSRRWAVPVAAAGAVGLLGSCLVTYLKFGLPFGLPMADQVWAHINAHRRAFLAANGGKAFSLRFIPSTAWAYLNPTALRISSMFPFLAAPATPAHAITNVTLDQTYATTSITAASPLLFLSACWGLVTAFRPRPFGGNSRTRLLLVGAAAATAGVLVWGYIAYRYTCDLLPLLIVAGAVGLIDVFRRLEGRRARERSWAIGAVCVLAAWCVAVNLAITATPSTWFNPVQLNRFVVQQANISPSALAGNTVVGGHRPLPYYGPAGQMWIAGSCDALYRSTGDSYQNSPGQQIEHATWAPVEQSKALVSTISLTFAHTHWTGPAVTILRYGPARLVLAPYPGNMGILRLVNPGRPDITWPYPVGYPFPQYARAHSYLTISVTTDPYLHSLEVTWYGTLMMNHYLAGSYSPQVMVTPPTPAGAKPPVLSVGQLPSTGSGMALCRGLLARSNHRG